MSPQECLEQIEKLDLSKELNLRIQSFSWGKSCNLIVNCLDMASGVEFFFCVFNDNRYKSKSEDFDFKEFKDNGFNESNNEITATFKQSKSGFLKCISAKFKEKE